MTLNFMKVLIKKAKIKDAESCLDCIKHSLLWNAYYKDSSALDLVIDAIRRKEIYVALNKNENCIGFMGIVPKGGFGQFPFLSILAVKKRYRNKNIGKQLLDTFETLAFKGNDCSFVLCSDFNKEAQKFYKKHKYIECGKIPGLFKPGITELIYIKHKRRNPDLIIHHTEHTPYIL